MKPTGPCPQSCSTGLLRLLDKNWQSFFAACDAYREDPSKFSGHPEMPHYKHKTDGRFLLVYTIQALSRPGLKRGADSAPSGLSPFRPNHPQSSQVRIVPRIGFYVVEVVYEQAEAAPSGNPALYAAVDIGVDNLAAITSNKAGFVPRLVNGRPIKSTNQFYNKRRAELQEALGHPGTTARLERLTTKRTRRINHYLHTASKAIIALLVAEGIGTLVVGKNPGWKQEAELGRVNNQHFVGLPHARFISHAGVQSEAGGHPLCAAGRKLHQPGIASWTAIPIPTYDPKQEGKHVFSGKRVKRGLYRAKDGRLPQRRCERVVQHFAESTP